MHIRWMSSLCFVAWLLFMGSLIELRAPGQCAGIATNPTAAADCAGHALPQDRVLTIDPGHPYTLAELIDIAERDNPRTRVLWERARQRAEALGVEKSAYFPVLAGLAAFGDHEEFHRSRSPSRPVDTRWLKYRWSSRKSRCNT